MIINREFCGDKGKSDKINEFLRKKNTITSTYVNMELNRTYLKDAYTLDTIFRENNSMEMIKERIEQISHNSVRERLEFLFERISQDDFTLREAKIRLERIIKWYHTILLKGIAVIPSRTRCEQLLPEKFQCRKTLSTCRVNEIVEENKRYFEEIRKELLKSVQKDSKMLRICRNLYEIIKNPYKAKEDPRNCFDIGDILIALDVPEGVTFISEDNHFVPICEILNVSFWRFKI
jgi:hypothetical protein